MAASLPETFNYASSALRVSVRTAKVIHRVNVTHQTATAPLVYYITLYSITLYYIVILYYNILYYTILSYILLGTGPNL